MNNHQYNQILANLKEIPESRERRNRHRFIMKMLDYRFPLQEFSTKLFVDDYNTTTRYIQMIQKDHPELRGKDYDDGKILAQRRVLESGYSTGYVEAHKQSKML
jgi:hypothetical protein